MSISSIIGERDEITRWKLRTNYWAEKNKRIKDRTRIKSDICEAIDKCANRAANCNRSWQISAMINSFSFVGGKKRIRLENRISRKCFNTHNILVDHFLVVSGNKIYLLHDMGFSLLLFHIGAFKTISKKKKKKKKSNLVGSMSSSVMKFK